MRLALEALRRSVQVAPLARILRDQGMSAALDSLRIERVLTPRLRSYLLPVVLDTYRAAGNSAAAKLTGRLIGKDISFRTRVESWGFDVLNPRGLEYLQRKAAQHVTAITEETRTALRAVLAEMHNAGVTPLEQAKRIKDYVGLTEGHARAVEHLRERLSDAGTGAGRIEQLVARKTRELLDLRALNISRTEGAFASAAGARESRAQAADEGLFEAATVVRVWMTAEDEATCAICEPMDGQESNGLDGSFTTGEGDEIDDAPAHVNCRCTTELRL